ncbi:hypothetical protein E0J21_17835 [Rhizobium laguerreae]|nr:hypothetical protein E0J21_17835 [Rhizobium laguerreae]
MPCGTPSALPGIPHRWGDHKWIGLSAQLPFRRAATLIVWGSPCVQLISPPVGEMPGRAEGVSQAPR